MCFEVAVCRTSVKPAWTLFDDAARAVRARAWLECGQLSAHSLLPWTWFPLPLSPGWTPISVSAVIAIGVVRWSLPGFSPAFVYPHSALDSVHEKTSLWNQRWVGVVITCGSNSPLNCQSLTLEVVGSDPEVKTGWNYWCTWSHSRPWTASFS